MTGTEHLEPERVTILRSEYEDLLRERRELAALEAGGVDNWVGYEYVDWHWVATGERLDDDE